MDSMAWLVERIKKQACYNIDSLCGWSAWSKELFTFAPDFIAIEPPELIGSGRAMPKENPAVITNSVHAAAVIAGVGGSGWRVICGSGITNDEDDVSKAMGLGSHGILVASSIIKADSWDATISELASGMEKE